MIIDSHVHLDVYTDKIISPVKRISNLKEIMKKSKISKSIVLNDIEDNSLSIDDLLVLLKNEKDIFLVGGVRVTNISDKDIKKLRELILNKKIIGIKLYPGYEEFYPNDLRCNKIWLLAIF